jgi:hypothetical protein
MAIKGASLAYCVVGGLVLYSGIKGATIADTAKAVLSGNLTVTSTEGITTPSGSTAGSTTGGSASNASSGTDSANLLTIAKYMVANGYSKAAAAGIAGCVAGESGGDPESSGGGGNGLIAWTPPKAGIVTGNATKDLQTQLPLIIEYNNAQGAGLIKMLNSISDPVSAADFYSENFERPLVKDSDVRSSVATSIFSQLGG